MCVLIEALASIINASGSYIEDYTNRILKRTLLVIQNYINITTVPEQPINIRQSGVCYKTI